MIHSAGEETEVLVADSLEIQKISASNINTAKSYRIKSQTGYPVEISYYAFQEGEVMTTLYPIYEGGSTYTVVIEFLDYDPLTDQYIQSDVDLLSYSGPSGMTAVKDGFNVKISGTANGVFRDSFFRVMLKDASVVTTTYDKIPPDFLALIEYSPPSSSVTSISHSLTVEIDNAYGTGSVYMTINIPQDVHWRWQPAIETQFSSLIARGRI